MRDEFFLPDELHPIDLVETLAESRAWEFDRLAEDRIAMVVAGQWRTYALTLLWSDPDETLRLICTFAFDPPQSREPALFELLNRINDQIWGGTFSWWQEEKLIVWRYALLLTGNQSAAAEQVEMMITTAVAACERYYPAFQLVAWSERKAADALSVALAPAWGHA